MFVCLWLDGLAGYKIWFYAICIVVSAHTCVCDDVRRHSMPSASISSCFLFFCKMLIDQLCLNVMFKLMCVIYQLSQICWFTCTDDFEFYCENSHFEWWAKIGKEKKKYKQKEKEM